MLVEEKHLRWAGIDMRARWRRRLAVVVTYAAFLWMVWAAPPRIHDVVLLLFYFSLLTPLIGSLEDVGAVMRWSVRVCIALVFGGLMFVYVHNHFRPHMSEPYGSIGFLALMLLVSRSVVGWGRLIESSTRGWLARSVARGASLPGWRQRGLARHGFGVGLEGFAQYEFGKKFGALTKEEQSEVLALHQANPNGKWRRERAVPLFNDERLFTEDAKIRVKVQRVMIWVLVGTALVCSFLLDDDSVIRPHVIDAGLWTLAAIMVSLRQAIPLWMEPDPRQVPGELAVLGEVAS